MPVSVWWIVAIAHADCPDGPVPPTGVSALLDRADAAFVDLEIPEFIALTDRIRAAVPCLSEAVDPALAARIHRSEGLRLFGERDVDAVRAFAAARSLEPDYVFPSDTVPDGSPILDDYVAMDLGAAEPETLPEPLTGSVLVDGRPTLERPRAWPALVQVIPGEGPPVGSWYLRHDDPVPSWPAKAPPPDPIAPRITGLFPEAPPRGPGIRMPLLVATGTSAVVSGALYGAAWASHGAWSDPETPDARLPGLRARTNGLTVASAASGLVTIGLGTALAVGW